jgi:hypothetical protein
MTRTPQPNLLRIPADGDARARTILQRVQGTVSQHFLDNLTERDCLALGRYGTRQATVAWLCTMLRRRS